MVLLDSQLLLDLALQGVGVLELRLSGFLDENRSHYIGRASTRQCLVELLLNGHFPGSVSLP